MAVTLDAGSVRFEPAGPHGTTVKIMMQYDPPAGPVGVAFANILGEDPDTRSKRICGVLKRSWRRQSFRPWHRRPRDKSP
jgi:uncharacterized membrane protein